MHEPDTRAGHPRHHGGARSVLAVVAVLSLVAAVTAMAPRIANSAASDDGRLSGLALAAPAAPAARIVHDIAIETVAPGREGLELSARLSDDGGVIRRPVTWRVARAGGEPVYSGDIAVADIAVEPGDFLVDIRYGAVHLTQVVSVASGTRLSASFVLDAGGLRILPRLQGLGPAPAAARSLVYALSGPRHGELIASSALPGEILRVPAGDYRIESRFEAGNASAVTDVSVKPGILSAVEIDHVAGLVHLAMAGASELDVTWTLTDAWGARLPPLRGSGINVVLKPGNYSARAENGSAVSATRFVVVPGEARDIVFGE